MVESKITSDQKQHVHITPTTASGKPSAIDGQVTFTVTSGDATVEEDADGLGAFLISGAVGTSTILVEADADLGSGVQTISEEISLVVSDPQASSLGLSFDPAVAK